MKAVGAISHTDDNLRAQECADADSTPFWPTGSSTSFSGSKTRDVVRYEISMVTRLQEAVSYIQRCRIHRSTKILAQVKVLLEFESFG